MEYQVVQTEISMDKSDLIIFGWQILHQPIRQIIHRWNFSVGGFVVLLCPGGHL